MSLCLSLCLSTSVRETGRGGVYACVYKRVTHMKQQKIIDKRPMPVWSFPPPTRVIVITRLLPYQPDHARFALIITPVVDWASEIK